MSRRQLDELIRHITNVVLNEYSSLSSTEQDAADEPTADSSVKPADAQTSAEKAREKRATDLQHKRELDMAKQAKDTEKEKAQSFKSQYDQWRRYGKQNDEKTVKDLQQKVATGAIAENIRKMRA